MARYYFNILDGERIDDEEGLDLPDLETARREAVRSAHSIMADAIWSGRLLLDESIEIVDEHRRVLMTILFRDTVVVPHDGDIDRDP